MQKRNDIVFTEANGTATIKFAGEFSYKDAKNLQSIFKKIQKLKGNVKFDFSELKSIDYAVLILLKNTLNGKKFEIITNDEKIKAMIDLLNH